MNEDLWNTDDDTATGLLIGIVIIIIFIILGGC